MKTAALLFTAFFAAACGGSVAHVSDGPDSGTPGTPGTSTSPSGTGSSTPTQPAKPTNCTDCIGQSIAWGMNGGLTGGTLVQSSVSTCRTYAHEMQSSTNPKKCTTTLGACSATTVGIADVERALADPDVQAAIASNVELYGSDPRGCDGAVFEIQIGARTIDIGGDCSLPNGCGPSQTKCVPVPQGLAKLQDLLALLDHQELARPACSAFW